MSRILLDCLFRTRAVEICCTSVETVVFDVNSEDVLYAIVGTEEKKQVTFQKLH